MFGPFLIMIMLLAALPVLAGDKGIPVEVEFPHKIVYTTNAAFDKTILIEDCGRRGGQFNECGSVCNDKAGEACVTVCAFTCELKKEP